MGYASITDIRGRTDLLQLINHHSIVGLDMRALLQEVPVWMPESPVYLEAIFNCDERVWQSVQSELFSKNSKQVILDLPRLPPR